MKTTNYTIYQLNDSDEAKKRLHMVFDDIKAKFDGRLYNKVWNGTYEPTEDDEKIDCHDENIKLLNCIIKDVNKDLPRGFYGHMVTTSDIILIDNDAWYVDEKGYKLLDGETLVNLPK